MTTSTSSRRDIPLARRTAALTAGLAITLTLAGCSGTGGGPGAAAPAPQNSANDGGSGDGGDVTLQFNWWGSDSREKLTQAAIDRFEEKHPNISVEMEYAGFSDYFDKLNTTIASGDLPDVFQVTDPYMYKYIDSGILTDLAQVDEIDLSPFSESSLFATTVDGGTYGAPSGESGFAILANPAVFEEAGVPLPDDETWSWQDYIDAAAAVSAALPGVTGAQIQWDEQMFTTYVRQQGEDLWLADGSDIGFTAESAGEWFALIEEMRDSGGFPSPEAAVETVGMGIEQMPISNGAGAMQLAPFGQLPVAEGTSGVTYELLKFPGESQGEIGMYTKPGIFYAIAGNTAHPQEAALLVDFLINDPDAAAELGFDRGVPSNPQILTALEPTLSDTDARIVSYIERVHASDPKPFPHQNANAGPILVAALNRYQQEVLFDRLSPQEAGEQFVAEIQAAL